MTGKSCVFPPAHFKKGFPSLSCIIVVLISFVIFPTKRSPSTKLNFVPPLWNGSKVTDATNMFSVVSLTTLNVSNWELSNATIYRGSKMFDCYYRCCFNSTEPTIKKIINTNSSLTDSAIKFNWCVLPEEPHNDTDT